MGAATIGDDAVVTERAWVSGGEVTGEAWVGGSTAVRTGERIRSRLTVARNLSSFDQSNLPESTMAPPVTVPLPVRYFVAEWTTRVAPCSMGRQR